jgi:hypothetical protein
MRRERIANARMRYTVERIWEAQDGRWFFLSTKSRSGAWRDYPFRAGEVDVYEFCQEHWERHLYFCPHGFTRPIRRKQYAVPGRFLYADLDAVSPRRIPFRPTIAFETSPGRYQALWKLCDLDISGGVEFDQEDLNYRLTCDIKSDPSGCDLTQVLRIPNTRNWKYKSEPWVKLLWCSGPTWRANNLNLGLVRVTHRVGKDAGADFEHRRASSLTMEQVLDKYSISRGWRQKFAKGQISTEQRHRVHWKLACHLHEQGVTPEDAFVPLYETPWAEYGTNRRSIWTMISKIWGDDA